MNITFPKPKELTISDIKESLNHLKETKDFWFYNLVGSICDNQTIIGAKGCHIKKDNLLHKQDRAYFKRRMDNMRHKDQSYAASLNT